MKLGVFGHVNVDVIMKAAEMPAVETTVLLDGYETMLGGTAANLGVNAAALGLDVSLFSVIGKDFPSEYLERLKKAKVDVSGIICSQTMNTPRCWIVSLPSGRQAALQYQGPWDGDMPEPDMGDVDLIHVGTGNPDWYRNMAEHWSCPYAFDPGQEIHYRYQRDHVEPLLSKAELFFCNQSEAKRTLTMLGLENIRQLADTVPVLVMTQGPDGAVIFHRGEEYDIPVYGTKTEDTTGCGDSFRAGFYYGHARSEEPLDWGLWGAALASFNAEAPGPLSDIPEISDVERRFRELKKEA